MGEVRTWKDGKKYRKTPQGWAEVKSQNSFTRDKPETQSPDKKALLDKIGMSKDDMTFLRNPAKLAEFGAPLKNRNDALIDFRYVGGAAANDEVFDQISNETSRLMDAAAKIKEAGVLDEASMNTLISRINYKGVQEARSFDRKQKDAEDKEAKQSKIDAQEIKTGDLKGKELLDAGKVNKLMSKRISVNGEMTTIKDIEHKYPYLKTHVKNYASKKINGEYAKLKNPKKEYMMASEDGRMLDIPKVVYDYFKNSGKKQEQVKKAKPAGEGEVRTWKDGNKYRKTNGVWMQVSEGKQSAAKPDKSPTKKEDKGTYDVGKISEALDKYVENRNKDQKIQMLEEVIEQSKAQAGDNPKKKAYADALAKEARKRIVDVEKEEEPKEEKKEDTPTLDTFKEMAKEHDNVNSFMEAIREIKNVPQAVADEFFDKYGNGGMSTQKQAAQKLMDEVKNEGSLLEEKKKEDTKQALNMVNADSDKAIKKQEAAKKSPKQLAKETKELASKYKIDLKEFMEELKGEKGKN